MHITPEHLDAFIVVPVYGFASDAPRLDLEERAYLERFSDDMLDTALAPESPFRQYLRTFPPDFVLRVSETVDSDFLLDRKLPQSEPKFESIFRCFGKSITAAIELVTCLRLYGRGLLQRGDIWIIITFRESESPGQLSLCFTPTGEQGFNWLGGEGLPYRVEARSLYQFQSDEVPYFRAFSERVRDILRRPKAPDLERTRLALSYYNRMYGVPQVAMRVVEPVTCLESLLTDQSEEISFRLALRCANLLGRDSRHRKKIYEEMKGFYDLRSKLVHGVVLKEKHKIRIQEAERLHEHVRRSLIASLGIILGGGLGTDTIKTLDEMSLDDDIRSEIQDKGSRLLHLNAATPRSNGGESSQ